VVRALHTLMKLLYVKLHYSMPSLNSIAMGDTGTDGVRHPTDVGYMVALVVCVKLSLPMQRHSLSV